MVGHPQVPQYLPGPATPVEGVGALVEAVTAPLVGAGPAALDVRLHDDHGLPGPACRRGRGQPGQPGPNYNYTVVLIFSHVDMTPRVALL
jgi:hypothetical protein